MNEWLIVRRPRPARKPRLESAIPIARPRSVTEPPAEDATSVSVEQAASQRDLKSPETIEILARPIPMALIKPMLSDPQAAAAAIAQAKAAGKAWGLQRLRVDPERFDGAGVSVAIIDTGIFREHVAFREIPPDSIEEADFTTKPNGVFGKGTAADEDGHGTHCAGTICGGVVDGVSIGIAPRIKRLLVAKAIGGDRGSAALIEALDWAVAQKADVISLSLGFDFVGYRDDLAAAKVHPAAATSMALGAFRDNIRVFDAWMETLKGRRKEGYDPLIVAASGNESGRPDFVVDKVSPSDADGIVSVGAVGPEGVVARFSNVRPTFVAPGVGIVSAGKTENLAVMDGTSMACPHIAGLAALFWQHARSMARPATAQRVLDMMKNSAERFWDEDNKTSDTKALFEDLGEGMPRAPGASVQMEKPIEK